MRIVRLADRVQHGRRAGRVARALRPQSFGRDHRRFSLVVARRTSSARSQYRFDFVSCDGVNDRSRRLVLPANGTQLRGRDMTASSERGTLPILRSSPCAIAWRGVLTLLASIAVLCVAAWF